MDQAGPYSVLAFSGAAVRAQAIEIMYMAVQAEPVLFRQFALQFFNALIADFHDFAAGEADNVVRGGCRAGPLHSG